MSRVWYVIVDGRQMGPINSDKVQGLINNGILKANDMLWREGMANWHTLKDLMKVAETHQRQITNYKRQATNKFQIPNSKLQTSNKPQEIFALPTKSIVLATLSALALGFSASAYWFTNETSKMKVELAESKKTINNYKADFDKLALQVYETDALSNHLKTMIAQISQQLKNSGGEMLTRIDELKSVASNNKEKYATKDDAKEIKSAIIHIEKEQNGLVVNFKSIESALESLAEKVLDMKMAMNESAETTPKRPLANKPQDISAEEYFSRGNKKYGSGDFKGAIDDYSKAVEINPSYATAFDKTGGCAETTTHSDNSPKPDPAIKSKTDKFVQNTEKEQDTE